MTSLPRAVLEAEEKANKLHEELIKQQQTEAAEQPPPQEPTPVDTQAQAADPVPPATKSDSTDDGYESRFKVLQGKYNAEVPRLSAENKDLKSKLTELEQKLDQMVAEKSREPLVKPEEIEEYGEGLIDVARRIAREELAVKQTEIDKLKDQIASLTSVTSQKVDKDFFGSLTDKVPDWEQINQDARFLAWLDEVDDLTGETRQNLLSRAEKSRDAERTAKFFQRFKDANKTWAAQATHSLDQQIAPPASPAPSTPQSKKVWTRVEVADFYDRMKRGSISDAEAIAIEADIMSAQIEGRIR